MSSDNIQPYVEPALMKGMTALMFCAHDEQEHALCYSLKGGHWRIENKNGLYLQYDTFQRASGDLLCITGISQTLWTVTNNPY